MSNITLRNYYETLDDRGKVLATYIWIDSTQEQLRQKTATLDSFPSDVSELKIWNFDGSSTGQASGNYSDVLLRPVAFFRDPFRRGNHILVFCECLREDGNPHPNDARRPLAQTIESCQEKDPLFVLEQQYTMLDLKHRPLGWPQPSGFPSATGDSYCGIGADRSFGRDIAEAHISACLFAGVKIEGMRGGLMPGQWAFRIGPGSGVEVADHLWVARFILHQVAEQFGVVISIHPNPVAKISTSFLPVYLATKEIREEKGLKAAEEAAKRLRETHESYQEIFRREQGREFSIEFSRELSRDFSRDLSRDFSRADLDPRDLVRAREVPESWGSKYLEDGRPASNCDPYVLIQKIAETVCF